MDWSAYLSKIPPVSQLSMFLYFKLLTRQIKIFEDITLGRGGHNDHYNLKQLSVEAVSQLFFKLSESKITLSDVLFCPFTSPNTADIKTIIINKEKQNIFTLVTLVFWHSCKKHVRNA